MRPSVQVLVLDRQYRYPTISSYRSRSQRPIFVQTDTTCMSVFQLHTKAYQFLKIIHGSVVMSSCRWWTKAHLGPFSVGIWCQTDIVSTSMRHDHVAPTPVGRHFYVICPLRLFMAMVILFSASVLHKKGD